MPNNMPDYYNITTATGSGITFGSASPDDQFVDEFEDDEHEDKLDEELPLGEEPPPTPTLFERLMAARPADSPRLRSEILEWVPVIATLEKGGSKAVRTDLSGFQVLAVGLAFTGYNMSLHDLIPKETRDHVHTAVDHILAALSKEEREAATPSTPFNLLKANVSLF